LALPFDHPAQGNWTPTGSRLTDDFSQLSSICNYRRANPKYPVTSAKSSGLGRAARSDITHYRLGKWR
jgi:hypothetical protein